MYILGSYAFCISDTNIDFRYIEDNLLIKPTKIIKRGQMIGKGKNIEAPYDIWSYEVAIQNCEDIFNDLDILIDNLLPNAKFIKEMKDIYGNVVINCYIRSNYGQIGFQLSDNLVEKLASIGLGLDFHILSFGEVKD